MKKGLAVMVFALFLGGLAVCCAESVPGEITFTTDYEGAVRDFRLAGQGSAVIDWGDGTPPETIALNALPKEADALEAPGHEYTHTYASGSRKTVTVRGALSAFYFRGGRIWSLDISGCPALRYLDCAENLLRSLDTSGNPGLEILNCEMSRLLKVLDISGNPALKKVRCDNGHLDTLTVGDNRALEVLTCAHNDLGSLAIGNTPALETLSCRDNALSSLDISGCPALRYLESGGNKLTGLDTAGNPALRELKCWGNEILSLDVSGNPALETLNCAGNKLKALDVRGNAALSYLDCSGNSLSAILLGGNPALGSLHCAYNNLDAAALIALARALPDRSGKGYRGDLVYLSGVPGEEAPGGKETSDSIGKIAGSKQWYAY